MDILKQVLAHPFTWGLLVGLIFAAWAFFSGWAGRRALRCDVKRLEALRILFEEAGYKRWFYKEKSSYSSYCALKEGAGQTRFHLELVTVNGMNYVEVELVINDEEGEAKAGVKTKKPEANLKAELEKFIVALGLNPADKDPRSWYQIISENNH